MRKIVFIPLLAAFIIGIFSFTTKPSEPVSAEEGLVKWYSWEEAVEASKKTKKKVFVDIYTDWCGWCKRMDKATFENPKVAKYLNEHYYPVKFNAEQKGTIDYNGHKFEFKKSGNRGYNQLAVALLDGRMSFPTTVFLNEDFEIMQRIPGFLEAERFRMILIYLAEDWSKKMSWEEFQEKFKENFQ